MKSRNIGRFKVAQVFFQGLRTGDGVNLFSGMIVLDVRHNWESDTVEYVAIHPDFRPVPECEMVPVYEGTFSDDSPFPKWHEIGY